MKRDWKEVQMKSLITTSTMISRTTRKTILFIATKTRKKKPNYKRYELLSFPMLTCIRIG